MTLCITWPSGRTKETPRLALLEKSAVAKTTPTVAKRYDIGAWERAMALPPALPDMWSWWFCCC